MKTIKHISKNEKETKKIAKQIINQIQNGGVILLKGDLGTGKTFLSKEIAKQLGVKKEIVKSPTYTYIQEYKTSKINIYHIDLYRIETYDELLAQEIIELTEIKNNVILIEWPEMLFTKDDFFKPIIITLKYITENKREITIQEH